MVYDLGLDYMGCRLPLQYYVFLRTLLVFLEVLHLRWHLLAYLDSLPTLVSRRSNPYFLVPRSLVASFGLLLGRNIPPQHQEGC